MAGIIQQGAPFDIFGNLQKLITGFTQPMTSGNVNWNAAPSQAGQSITTPEWAQTGLIPKMLYGLFGAQWSPTTAMENISSGKATQIGAGLGAATLGAPLGGAISAIGGGVGAGAAQVGTGVGGGLAGLGTGAGQAIGAVGAGAGTAAETGLGGLAAGIQSFLPLIIFGVIAYVIMKKVM